MSTTNQTFHSLATVANGQQQVERRQFIAQVWRRMRRDPLAFVGLLVIIVVILAAVFAPLIAPMDPLRPNPATRLAPPGTGSFLLGTDHLGRDILSRLIWGGRISLIVGFVPVVASAIVGVALGLIAGFYGRRLDAVISRTLDVFFAFPTILLALVIVSALGPSIFHVMIAITIVAVPTFARLIRASVLSIKEQSFIDAGRALGASNRRLILQHILPNTVSPVIVFGTLETGKRIVFAAALSFLGLGVQPPTPEWGAMLSDGRNVLAVAPHVSTIPGLVIFLVSLSFNILGDALRDALDPHQQS